MNSPFLLVIFKIFICIFNLSKSSFLHETSPITISISVDLAGIDYINIQISKAIFYEEPAPICIFNNTIKTDCHLVIDKLNFIFDININRIEKKNGIHKISLRNENTGFHLVRIPGNHLINVLLLDNMKKIVYEKNDIINIEPEKPVIFNITLGHLVYSMENLFIISFKVNRTIYQFNDNLLSSRLFFEFPLYNENIMIFNQTFSELNKIVYLPCFFIAGLVSYNESEYLKCRILPPNQNQSKAKVEIINFQKIEINSTITVGIYNIKNPLNDCAFSIDIKVMNVDFENKSSILVMSGSYKIIFNGTSNIKSSPKDINYPNFPDLNTNNMMKKNSFPLKIANHIANFIKNDYILTFLPDLFNVLTFNSDLCPIKASSCFFNLEFKILLHQISEPIERETYLEFPFIFDSFKNFPFGKVIFPSIFTAGNKYLGENNHNFKLNISNLLERFYNVYMFNEDNEILTSLTLNATKEIIYLSFQAQSNFSSNGSLLIRFPSNFKKIYGDCKSMNNLGSKLFGLNMDSINCILYDKNSLYITSFKNIQSDDKIILKIQVDVMEKAIPNSLKEKIEIYSFNNKFEELNDMQNYLVNYYDELEIEYVNGVNWKIDAENTFKNLDILTARSLAPLTITFKVSVDKVKELFIFLNKTDIYGNNGGFPFFELQYVAFLEDPSHKKTQCRVFINNADNSVIFNIRFPFILLKENYVLTLTTINVHPSDGIHYPEVEGIYSIKIIATNSNQNITEIKYLEVYPSKFAMAEIKNFIKSPNAKSLIKIALRPNQTILEQTDQIVVEFPTVSILGENLFSESGEEFLNKKDRILNIEISSPIDFNMKCTLFPGSRSSSVPIKLICNRLSRNLNTIDLLEFYFEVKNPDVKNNIFIPIIIYSQNNLKKTNFDLLEHSLSYQNEQNTAATMIKTIDPIGISDFSTLSIDASQIIANKDNILLLYFDYDLKFPTSDIKIEGASCNQVYLKTFKLLFLKFLTNDQKVLFKIKNIINPENNLFHGIKAYLLLRQGFDSAVITFDSGSSIEFSPKKTGTFVVDCDNNELYSKSKCSFSFITEFQKLNYIKISLPSQLKILHDICFPKIDSEVKVLSCQGDHVNNQLTIKIIPDLRFNIKLLIETKEEGIQILDIQNNNLDFLVEGFVEIEGNLGLSFKNIFSQIFTFIRNSSAYDALSFLDYDNIMMEDEAFYTSDIKNSSSFLKFSIIFDYETVITDGAMIIQLPHPDLEILINDSKAGNLVKNKLVCFVNDEWKYCNYKINGIPGSTIGIIRIYNLSCSIGGEYIFYISVVDSLGKNYIEKFKRNKNSLKITAHIYYDSDFQRALFYITPEIFLMTLNLFSSFNIEILTSFSNAINLFYINFKVDKIINQLIIEFPVFTYDKMNAWDPNLGGFEELNQFPCSFGTNNIISADDPPYCLFRAGSNEGFGIPAKVMVNNFVVKDLKAINTIILTGFSNPKNIDVNVPLKLYGMKDKEIMFYQETKRLFKTITEKTQNTFMNSRLPMSKSFLRNDSFQFQLTAGCAKFFLVKIKNDECFFNDVDNISKFRLKGFFGSELIKFHLIILDRSMVTNEIIVLKNVLYISCNSVKFDFFLFESEQIGSIFQFNYYITFSDLFSHPDLFPFIVGTDKVVHDFAIKNYAISDNVAILTFELPSFYSIIQVAANLNLNIIMIVKLKLPFYKKIKECMVLKGLNPRQKYNSVVCQILQPDAFSLPNLKILNFERLILNTSFQIYIKFDSAASGQPVPTNGDNALDIAFYSNELALNLNNPFIYSSIAFLESNIDKIKKADYSYFETNFEVNAKDTGCNVKFNISIYEASFPSIKIILPLFLRRIKIAITMSSIFSGQSLYNVFNTNYNILSNTLEISFKIGEMVFLLYSSIMITLEISNLLLSFDFLFFRVIYGNVNSDFYTTKVTKSLNNVYRNSKKFLLELAPAIYNKPTYARLTIDLPEAFDFSSQIMVLVLKGIKLNSKISKVMQTSPINLPCLMFKKNSPIQGSCNSISDYQIYIRLVSIDFESKVAFSIDDQFSLEIPHLIILDTNINNLGADLYIINLINALNFDNFLTSKVKPGIQPMSMIISPSTISVDSENKQLNYNYDKLTGNLVIYFISNSLIQTEFIYVDLIDFGEFSFKSASPSALSRYFTGYFPFFRISTGGLYSTKIEITIEEINIMNPLKLDCSENLKVNIFYQTPSGNYFHETDLSDIPFQNKINTETWIHNTSSEWAGTPQITYHKIFLPDIMKNNKPNDQWQYKINISYYNERTILSKSCFVLIYPWKELTFNQGEFICRINTQNSTFTSMEAFVPYDLLGQTITLVATVTSLLFDDRFPSFVTQVFLEAKNIPETKTSILLLNNGYRISNTNNYSSGLISRALAPHKILIHPIYAKALRENEAPFRIIFKTKKEVTAKKIILKVSEKNIFVISNSKNFFCQLRYYTNPNSIKSFFWYSNTLSCDVTANLVTVTFDVSRTFYSVYYYELMIGCEPKFLESNMENGIYAFEKSGSQYLRFEMYTQDLKLVIKSSKLLKGFIKYDPIVEINALYYTNAQLNFTIFLDIKILKVLNKNEYLEFVLPSDYLGNFTNEHPCYVKYISNEFYQMDPYPDCVQYIDSDTNLNIRLLIKQNLIINDRIIISFESLSHKYERFNGFNFIIKTVNLSMIFNEILNYKYININNIKQENVRYIEKSKKDSETDTSYYSLLWKRASTTSKIWCLLTNQQQYLNDMVESSFDGLFELKFSQNSIINYKNNFEVFDFFISNQKMELTFKNSKNKKIYFKLSDNKIQEDPGVSELVFVLSNMEFPDNQWIWNGEITLTIFTKSNFRHDFIWNEVFAISSDISIHKIQYSIADNQISLEKEQNSIDFVKYVETEITYDLVEWNFENFIGKIVHCYFLEKEINIMTFTQKKVEFHLVEKKNLKFKCLFAEIAVASSNSILETYKLINSEENSFTHSFNFNATITPKYIFEIFFMNVRDHVNQISKILMMEKENDCYSLIKAKTLVLNVNIPEKSTELFLNISTVNIINDKQYSIKCFCKKRLSVNTYGMDYQIKNCLHNANQIIYLSLFDIEFAFSEDYVIQIKFEDDNEYILNQIFGMTPLKLTSWLTFQEKKIKKIIIIQKAFENPSIYVNHKLYRSLEYSFIELGLKFDFLKPYRTKIFWILIDISFENDSFDHKLYPEELLSDSDKSTAPCIISENNTKKKGDCFLFIGDQFGSSPHILLNLTLDISMNYKVFLPLIMIPFEKVFLSYSISGIIKINEEFVQIFQNKFHNKYVGPYQERDSNLTITSSENPSTNNMTGVKISLTPAIMSKSIEFVMIKILNNIGNEKIEILPNFESLNFFSSSNFFFYDNHFASSSEYNSFEFINLDLEKIGFSLQIELIIFSLDKSVFIKNHTISFIRKVIYNTTTFSLKNGFVSPFNVGIFKFKLEFNQLLKHLFSHLQWSLPNRYQGVSNFLGTCNILSSYQEKKEFFIFNFFSCFFNYSSNSIKIDHNMLNFKTGIEFELFFKSQEMQRSLASFHSITEYLLEYDSPIVPVKNFDMRISVFSNNDCLDNLFFFESACLEKCPFNFREDYLQRKCVSCPDNSCKICDSLKCLECIDSSLFFIKKDICEKKRIILMNVNIDNSLSSEASIIFNDTFPELEKFSQHLKSIQYGDEDPIAHELYPMPNAQTNFKLKFTLEKKNLKNDTLIEINLVNLTEFDYMIKEKNFKIIIKKDEVCDEEHKFDREKRICRSLINIYPKLVKTLDARTIKIKFQNDFGDIFDKLKNKINITIENLKENDYNYSITRDAEDSDSFLINFDFKESVRGNPSLKVNFNFKQEEKLDPDFFFIIKNVLIETKLNDYYPLSTSSQKFINTTTKITSTLNVMGTVIASSVVIANPGASFSVTCLLAIGMLKYLRHLPIDYPPNLIAIFSSFEEFTGTWEGLYYKDKGEDGEFDYTFENYGISIYFLNNIGKRLILLSIIFLIGITIILIEYFCKYFKLKMIEKIDLWKLVFNWNVFIYLYYSWILDFAFNICLAFKFPTLITNYGILNFILTSFHFCSLFIFILLIYQKRRGIRDHLSSENSLIVYSLEKSLNSSSSNTTEYEDETKKLRDIKWLLYSKTPLHSELSGYFLLYKDFSYIGIFQSFFMIISPVRYILYAIIIIYLRDFMITCLTFLILINVFMLVFHLLTQPYYEFLDNLQFCLNEFSLLGANICTLVFAVFQSKKTIVDENVLLNLGWAIIFFNSCMWLSLLLRYFYYLFLALKYLVVMIIKKITLILQLLKKKNKNIKNKVKMIELIEKTEKTQETDLDEA